MVAPTKTAQATDSPPKDDATKAGNYRSFTISAILAAVLISGFIATEVWSVLRHHAEVIADERRAQALSMQEQIESAYEVIASDLNALRGLYLASENVDQGELQTFSETALATWNRPGNTTEYGWVPDNAMFPSFLIQNRDGIKVTRVQPRNVVLRTYLENQLWRDDTFAGSVPGGILDARLDDFGDRITFPLRLVRPSGSDGTLFVTLSAQALLSTMDARDTIFPVGLTYEARGRSTVLLADDANPALGAVETATVPTYQGNTVLSFQVQDVPFWTFFVENELRRQAVIAVVFLFILATALLNLRQIRLGQLAAAKAMLAAKEAEDSSYQKTRFLATMSHEMRTPLNGIIGMADLIKGPGLAPEKEKYLQTLTSSAEGLLALINQLLDFSKVEAQQIELEIREVNLGDLVTDVANASNILAAEKGVEFILTLPMQACIPVEIDGFKLRQVLTNLVSNAIKFTEKGSVRLSVELVGKTSKTNATFRFSVRDTGIGIAQDRLQKIFEPFQQADVSTTRQFGGTGLGLTITRDILQAMGSEITVTSEIGEGTQFTFELAVNGDIFARPLRRKACFLGIHKILLYGPQGPLLHSVETAVATAGATVEVASDLDTAESVLLGAYDIGDPIDMALVMDVESARELQSYRGATDDGHELKLGLLRSSTLAGHAVTQDEQELSDFLIDFPHTSPSIVERIYSALSNRQVGKNKTTERIEAKQVDFTGARVLLVDDDKTNQLYGLALLQRMGCVVTQAWNGQEAIDALDKDWSLQIILLDCQMPVMDGFTAANILRRRMSEGTLAKVPVVALTANASASDRQACMEAGMDDFLAKPVREPDLFSVMSKWIETSASAPTSAAPARADTERAPAQSAETTQSAPPSPAPAAKAQTPLFTTPAMPTEPAAPEPAAPEPAAPEPSAAPAATSAPAPTAPPAKAAIANLEAIPAPAQAQPPAQTKTQSATQPAASPQVSFEGDVLDVEILKQTRDALGDAFQHLLQTFMSSTPETLTQLRQGLGSKDYDVAQRSAHSLKSSAKMVGAMAMANAALALEAECKKSVPSPSQTKALFATLEAAFEAYSQQLRQRSKMRKAG